MKTFNFTKTTIQNLPIPSKGYATYADIKEKGLKLYVTSKGTKSFFVRKMINGRDERIILGSFPEVSIEKARDKALKVKAKAADGINPNIEKHKINQEITLGDQYLKYLEEYAKKHKKHWKEDAGIYKRYLVPLQHRKLSAIARNEIERLHSNIAKEKGIYAANDALVLIRTFYNKAIEWGWEGANPTSGIKKFKEKSRERFIQPEELPFFFQSLDEEYDTTGRDYIKLSLLTGARRSNMLSMRWEDVKLDRKEWYIKETKNGEPQTITLSNVAIDILKERLKEKNTSWVFPSKTSSSGHLTEPKKVWRRVLQRATLLLWQADPTLGSFIQETKAILPKNHTVERLFKAIQDEAGKEKIDLPLGLMDLRIHDLRRTLGSYQAISGANSFIIGKSLNHKSPQSTAIYARLNLDPVRASIEKATEAMFGGKQDA